LFVGAQSICLAEELKVGIPDLDIFETVFSGEESLAYEVCWTGGIKIGDLFLQVKKNDIGGYVIHARIKDYGMFRFFYPVDDTFATFVRGRFKLPYRYEVLQNEGKGDSVTRRLTRYDQQQLRVRYQRDDEEESLVPVAGTVHNEFSSFYATRAMDLVSGNDFIVPTFADKERNEVKVQVMEKEQLESIIGTVSAIKVMPVMKFKGLYDKAGDTVIWITDDTCRVPVKINSKILIGSLTAELVAYDNPACGKYK